MKAIIAILFFMFTFTLSAQKVTVDSKGNYVSVSSTKQKADTVNTGKTFTDSKGIVYPVFKSSTGKLYVPRISKSGNYYRYYLKVEA